ncbi:MAG: PilZ domain-containing protein [Candidatus Omnitrophica bacterium]|nr:PilZ domain-containing protein [Candidatus Omnitrophota bacterium]
MVIKEINPLERRKYPRVPISFPVECNVLSTAKYFYTVSKDLSTTGIKILSDHFFSKDKLFKVSINFVDKVMQLKARVAWCAQSRSPDTYLAGLEFVEVPLLEQKALVHFLGKIQTPA